MWALVNDIPVSKVKSAVGDSYDGQLKRSSFCLRKSQGFDMFN